MRFFSAAVLVVVLSVFLSQTSWFHDVTGWRLFDSTSTPATLKSSPSSASEECTLERTFAMIKPDAAQHSDQIAQTIEDAGFVIKQQESITLSKDLVRTFYEEHSARGFFNDLVDYISGGPVVKMVLEKPCAIRDWRALIGPTDSNKARETSPHTIRARFGKDKTFNAVHGSDSTNSAMREIAIMFPDFL